MHRKVILMTPKWDWPGKSLFYTGDIVKVLRSPPPGWEGQIVEMRGPLAPGREQVYSVELFWKLGEGHPVEFPEHLLKLITPSPYRPADFAAHSAG